jgi:hypothetical protein
MPSQAPKGLGNVVPLGAADVPQGSPPSSYAAHAVVQGERGALVRFAGLTVLRSLLIAPGMAVVGVRGRPLLLGSLAASGLISVAAIGYCWSGRRASMPSPLRAEAQPIGPPPPNGEQSESAVDTDGEEVSAVGVAPAA